MRSTPKPTLIATIMFLCVCCAQFAEAQRQTEGQVKLPLDIDSKYLMELPALRDPRNCCPKVPSCCSPIRAIKSAIRCESSGDVAILIDFPKDSTPDVEEILFQIYSMEGELVFSGETQRINLRATDNSTSYLMALDKTAASIAQLYFIDENKIAIAFKATGDKGMPGKVYLVNINEINEDKPVK